MRLSAQLALTVLILLAGVLAGCASQRLAGMQAPYEVTQHVNGAYTRTVVSGRTWYQTHGLNLLTIDARSGSTLARIAIGRPGHDGAAVDMTAAGDRVWVVLGGTAVVEVDAESPEAPRVVRRWTADELHIEPHHVRRINGRVFVSGRDGAVEIMSGERHPIPTDMHTLTPAFGPVSMTVHGPAAAIGRQLRTLRRDRFLGAAHELIPLQESSHDDIDRDAPRWVYLLHGEESSEIGLKSHTIRAVHRVSLDERIVRVRHRNDRVWAVTPTRIIAYRIDDNSLAEAGQIDIAGARDLDRIDDDTLAISGEFGRATYHQRRDRLFIITRPPADLSIARFDGRQLVTGDGERFWRLRLGGEIERSFDQDVTGDGINRHAESIRYRATIDDERPGLVQLRGEFGEIEFNTPQNAAARTLVMAGNQLWIGHDRGIEIIRLTHGDEVQRIQSIRLPEGVQHLFTLLRGDGVVYVSRNGGLGVIERRE